MFDRLREKNIFGALLGQHRLKTTALSLPGLTDEQRTIISLQKKLLEELIAERRCGNPYLRFFQGPKECELFLQSFEEIRRNHTVLAAGFFGSRLGREVSITSDLDIVVVSDKGPYNRLFYGPAMMFDVSFAGWEKIVHEQNSLLPKYWYCISNTASQYPGLIEALDKLSCSITRDFQLKVENRV